MSKHYAFDKTHRNSVLPPLVCDFSPFSTLSTLSTLSAYSKRIQSISAFT